MKGIRYELFRLLVAAAAGFVVALVVWRFWPEVALALAVVPMVVALLVGFALRREASEANENTGGGSGSYISPNQCQPALSAAGVGAWIWDFQSNELHCTQDVFKILGRDDPQPKLTAEVFEKGVHLDDREVFKRAVEAVKAGTRRSPLDCRFVKPGGGVVWVELTMCLVVGDAGQMQIAGAMTDVTERKHVEAQLDRGAASLEAILESTDNIVFSIDSAYRLTVLNSRFTANVRFSYGKTLHLGDDILDAAPREVAALWKPRYQRVLGGDSLRVEEVFEVKGIRYYFDVSMNPIREHGQVTGVAVYSRNITRQKIREKEWLEAKERAEESDRLKSAFLANMSHEIRTPLNAVMGFAQLLKTGDGTKEDREKFIDIILSNGNHLLKILGDIIDLAQIESNQLRVEPITFDLGLMLAETYSVFFDRIRSQSDGHIELVVDSSLQDSNYVLCDETRLKQVIYNLVSNSIKFTSEGSIRVGYERKEGGMIEFFVADTGSGIPEESREHVFKRFRQGKHTVGRRNDGVGLGLSICQGLVALLGGEIWVEDNFPCGSIFKFTIRDHSNEVSVSAIRPQESEGTKPLLQPTKLMAGCQVLVAEDDDMNFKVIDEFLRNESLVALRAVNGQEAIHEVERNPEIQLVVMDLSMPVLNGLEATKRIKEMRPELTVIAHTAHAMQRELDLALAAGCSDCLVKPISMERFKALLARYV